VKACKYWTEKLKQQLHVHSSVIIIAVISVVPYLTDMGEHIAFYMINKMICIDNSKIRTIQSYYCIPLTPQTMQTHKCTHAHLCVHSAQKECNEKLGWGGVK